MLRESIYVLRQIIRMPFIFYQKLGFKHEGKLKKYFKRENENQFIDELLMALLLE